MVYKIKNTFFSSKLFNKYNYLLLVLILFFLPCVLFCYLDEIVTTSGQIRPIINESVVKVLFSGTVTNVTYKNSEFINAGDLLVELDSSYEQQKLNNLEELKKLYQNEVKESSDLLNLIDKADKEDLPNQMNLTYISSNCIAFISEYKKYKKQTRLAEDNYERQKPLYPSAISKSELEEYENEYLQTKFSFVTWFENQKIKTRESYAESTKNLQNCQIQIMQVNKEISNSKVFAQTSGYINEVNKIKIGDYLNCGTQILTIIPDSDYLKCIASVSASNISKIKIGQEAVIQINDLPWTRYGKLKGYVSLVPSDCYPTSENFASSIFLVEITLSQNYLQDRKKEKVFLHIGSSANVSIKVSKNTILQKFLQNLVSNE